MNKRNSQKQEHKPELHSTLHSLISIVISVIVLTSGLFMQSNKQIFFFIIIVTFLTVLSGNYFSLLKIALYLIPLIMLIVFLTFLITGDLSYTLITIYRFTIIGLSMSFTINMNPTELSRSLSQLGCPRRVSLAILVVFSYLPVLRKEIGKIKEAMKVRGINWWNPVNYYRVLFLPLIIRIVEMSDVLALSIETRGFVMRGGSSVYRKVSLRKKDYIIFTLLIFGTIISFILF